MNTVVVMSTDSTIMACFTGLYQVSRLVSSNQDICVAFTSRENN